MRHSLSNTSAVYAFDKQNKPAIKVDPGDTVTIETYDCFTNQVKSETTELKSINWDEMNPATGPVFVNGAQPGDILKVTIDELKIGERGVMVTGPDLGVMGDHFDDFDVKIVPIQDDKAIFDENVQIPLNKMIGVIGVAPEEGSINCGTPGAHGGNMDTTLVTEGATLYFPVAAEGALFATGDFHAAMGDGEISVSGIEVPGEVTVTFDVIKGHSIKHPLLENEDGIAFLASAETLDEATKLATRDMIALLHPHTDLTLSHLTMLMSATGNAQISQVVDPLITARFFVPKYILNAYNISLFKD
ncbi:acetamidase/formamidase family protein [Oceanobacillus halotolerans]|uniref:acetamidase/formamidase family protein n=1 Tax=Oceanobacillus halotolerans TaxID=2663380 RepID=UPI0013DB29EC|nr:acetamidase/formamidase family protein [Oceanobacillus halotolerans]